jgi:phosphoribosyl 1,2-cyclic phosphate phosphodiesterase
MEVRILGSGGSEGIPAFLCLCRVCQEARRLGGREVRQNASAHVRLASGMGVLIDLPPQFKMAWDRSGLPEDGLAAILVTHRHEDHTLGLKYLVEAGPANGYLQARTMTVYLPVDVLTGRVRQLDPKHDYPPEGLQGPFVTFLPLAAYRPLTLGGCRITPLETNHQRPQGEPGGPETLGFLFEDADGARMAYLIDAQPDLPERTAAILSAARLDCLIFECNFAALDPPVGHVDIPSLVEAKRRFRPRCLVATHISHRNLGHRELTARLAPEGIRAAYDGMKIRVRRSGAGAG